MPTRITYALLAAALAAVPADAQDTLTLDAVYARAAARKVTLTPQRYPGLDALLATVRAYAHLGLEPREPNLF